MQEIFISYAGEPGNETTASKFLISAEMNAGDDLSQNFNQKKLAFPTKCFYFKPRKHYIYFNFYRMEKVLLFLVLATIGAYLTRHTAPLVARERKCGWLLHFLASGGIMFIVFVLSFSVSAAWAVAALAFCAVTIYTTAYSLYRKKMKEHDPENIAPQIDCQETDLNQTEKSTLNLFFLKESETNKRLHYQYWFDAFCFRFAGLCIAILCIRMFLVSR